MTNPLVTVGVPAYRGQDTLPVLLDCLRSQSYRDIDVLISIDGADQASAEACKPHLRQDSRFRMRVQLSRLGWAGNTDWTMRHRRSDFYIYQQHNDLVSPTYIADLVEASARWPNAVICFSKVKLTGRLEAEISAPSLLGDPMGRVLKYLRRLDWVPFRGLILGSALDKTAGLLLSDFDPFDSFGTELRFMAELSLVGEFRLVEGRPTYFKSWHGENLSGKRAGWTREHQITAHACLAAWMIEVIVPAASSVQEKGDLFRITLDRFAGTQGLPEWIASVNHWLRHGESKTAVPLGAIKNQLKRHAWLAEATRGVIPLEEISSKERSAITRQIFERLKSGGRFDPRDSMRTTWEALETQLLLD